jgi:hypothetical protein
MAKRVRYVLIMAQFGKFHQSDMNKSAVGTQKTK